VFIALGIMGAYIARIYDELKQRPQFIIKTSLGFDEGTGHDK
jgi:hypothetical protein